MLDSFVGANRPETKIVPAAALKAYAGTVRTHNKKQTLKLAAGLRHFGQIVPIIVDQDLTIIDGHAIWEALKALGHDEVSVVIVHGRTDPELRALRLALNRLALDAGWDTGKLRRELQSLIEVSYDLDLTGFDAVEIDHLLDVDCGGDTIEDADAVAQPCGVAVSRRGDIWACGPHRVGCGDALDLGFVQELLAGSRPAMSFIDAPYNVPVHGFVSGNGATQHREFLQGCGEMSEAQFVTFLCEALTVLKSVLADGALIYACMDWRHIFELLTAIRQASLELVSICVWAKTTPGLGLFYRSQHELVTVVKSGEGSVRNNMNLGKQRRNRSNLWTYRGMNVFGDDRDELVKVHPTVKPLALIADAIRDVTKRGDAVIDVFLGSGSTVMAAEETGRLAYGIDIDPLYIDVAVRRWQQQTKSDAVHRMSGEMFEERARRLAEEPTEAEHVQER